MKFSYKLIKKLATKIPKRDKFVDKFNLYAFEAKSLPGDVIEVSVPPNRYSDAASHWGLARLAAAIFGGVLKFKEPDTDVRINLKNTKPEVKVIAKSHTKRYLARYFEIPKVSQSPTWLKDILFACGLRPINAVVDVMNYVILETGQPLHVFDAALVHGPIQIRFAKKGEEIKTIDGQDLTLGVGDLVIADNKGPLAIAGVKGGKRAEVNPYTKKIIVEAANFDPTSIYKTSRFHNLVTDASSRFAHGLSPALAETGLARVAELLKDVCEAKIGEMTDISFSRQPKIVLKFDINEFNKLTGLNFSEAEALEYLKRMGFGIKGKLVFVPPNRTDIAIHADLAEEIVNLYGYHNLPDVAPVARLFPATEDEQVLLKDRIREMLRGFGMSEVYNYSFVSRKDLTKYAEPKWWGAMPLRNPISSDYQYLRPDLVVQLKNNLDDNFRFYDAVKIFEIGKTFPQISKKMDECLYAGIIIGYKKPARVEEPFLELKGVADQLLQSLGVVDYFFRDEDWDVKYYEEGHSLRIEDGNHRVLGRIGVMRGNHNAAYAKLNLGALLKTVTEEKEYEPLPKYPSIMRDLSLLVSEEVRVNQLMEIMENAAPEYLDDVDLIDYYEDEKLKEGRKSLTFRLVFLADDRTLTDKEVGAEMEKIISGLQSTFDVEVR